MPEPGSLDKDGLEIRRMSPSDAAAALALRNKVFPPISLAHWRQSQTASVALLEGELIGVVPFAIRGFEIAPGVPIRAAFANSVAVAEGFRDLGVGTRMMEEARGYLPSLAEAMMVYTEGERAGLQYRFYRKTGHYDLLYPRRFRREPPGAHDTLSHATVLPIESITEIEADLLRVYRSCYANHAGTPRRTRGYWDSALASQIFIELPYERLGIVVVSQDRSITAYAIVGLREGELVVLEAAAEVSFDPRPLWEALEDIANRWHAEGTVMYGQDLGTPLYASLLQSGFEPERREDVLVGQVLAYEDLYALRWQAASDALRPTLEIWTPERDLVLGGEPGAARISLEMKEEALHRLLLARTDLVNAVHEQYVTMLRGERRLVDEIGVVLRAVPWVYHHLDYV
jgi:ribosomal protein S18 acetylase RimI-like enzyme